MGVIYNRKQAYQDITNQIVKMLQEGKVPWHNEWLQYQIDFLTKRIYSGFNQLWLTLTMNFKRYKSPYWLGYKQVQKLKGKVKKGETGSRIYFFSRYIPCNVQKMCGNCKEKKSCLKSDMIQATNKNEKIKDINTVYKICEDYEPMWKVILQSHVVFNIEQTTLEIPNQTEEYMFDYSGIKKVLEGYTDIPPVLEGGTRAFYNRKEDYIGMPIKRLFFSEEAYYSTLFHELVHSTGYEKRLNRKSLYSIKGSEQYAFEELIAELGAMFLCLEAKIKNKRKIENSAAYIQSWIKVLQNNPDWIFKASRQAEKAVNYILRNMATEKNHDHDSIAA